MGAIKRFFRWLFAPSKRLAVIVLLLIGLFIGAGLVVSTQVAVAVTGTNEFCGTACHSHAKFIYPGYKASIHFANPSGVRANCADCHIPHTYPDKLFYKTAAGIRDMIAEMRGTISTQEKYDRERWRLANRVWDKMRANDSATCRACHDPAAMAGQNPRAQRIHQRALNGEQTCIDCHMFVAHPPHEEPAPPGAPAAPAPAEPAAPPPAEPAKAS